MLPHETRRTEEREWKRREDWDNFKAEGKIDSRMKRSIVEVVMEGEGVERKDSTVEERQEWREGDVTTVERRTEKVSGSRLPRRRLRTSRSSDSESRRDFKERPTTRESEEMMEVSRNWAMGMGMYTEGCDERSERKDGVRFCSHRGSRRIPS